MINQESLIEAKCVLNSNISMVDYYKDFVDDDVDLGYSPLVNCPLHDESTPSFKYFDDTNTFYCFGCGKGGPNMGTVVDLHYYLNKRNNLNYSIVKSIYELSRVYKIQIPDLYKVSDMNCLEKALRGYGKVKTYNLDIETPLRVIQNQVERYLKVIKQKDFNLYIEYLKKVDNAYMLKDDEKLRNLLVEVKSIGGLV